MTYQYYLLFNLKIAAEKLAKHLQVHFEQLHFPALTDLNVPHHIDYANVRYDVKIAKAGIVNSEDKEETWDFDLREKGSTINKNMLEKAPDFYLLVGVEDLNKTRVFLIPITDAPASHIRISIKGSSKYHQYEI